jgi:hypothetical protein
MVTHNLIDSYQISLLWSDSVITLTNHNGNPCIIPLTKNDYVSSKLQHGDAFIFCNNIDVDCNTFLDTNYVGFQIKRKGNNYYGWLKAVITQTPMTIKFLDCCFSLCSNDSIKVGKTPN